MNRLEILQQLAAGTITPDEAERLLRGGSTPKPQPEPQPQPEVRAEAAPDPAPQPQPEPEKVSIPVSNGRKGEKPRWVNIAIDSGEPREGKRRAKVDVRLPYGILNFLLGMGSRFSDDQAVREAMQALRSEGVGTILNIEADSGEKIRIVLE